MSAICNIQTLDRRSARITEELDTEGVERMSRGEMCAMGFFNAISRMPEDAGIGRSIRNEELERFFWEFFKLTDWDIDPYEFHFLLNCWIDDGLIPLTLIRTNVGEYESIGGIDLELLGELFRE